TVLSYDPVTSFAPSRENATADTASVWPASVPSSLPPAASNSRTVLSAQPTAASDPSGEYATARPSSSSFTGNGLASNCVGSGNRVGFGAAAWSCARPAGTAASAAVSPTTTAAPTRDRTA